MQKVKLAMVVLWLGQKCTLRCKDCCNLIPYLEQSSYDLDIILKSLKNLLEMAEIEYLQIQGGEPFTYPHIGKVLQIVNKLPIPKLHIATNGTIPISNEVAEVLKTVPRISIGISNYEVTKDKRQKFIDILEENKREYLIYNFMYGDESWFQSGGPNEKRNNNSNYISKMYTDCGNRTCTTLANGSLYTCGKMKAIHHLHNNIVFPSDSTVNLLEEDSSLRYDNLAQFVNNTNNFKEECRYCKGTYEKVKPGIQLNPARDKKNSNHSFMQKIISLFTKPLKQNEYNDMRKIEKQTTLESTLNKKAKDWWSSQTNWSVLDGFPDRALKQKVFIEKCFIPLLNKTNILGELACATGDFTFLLAPYVNYIDAYDISAPMIDNAKNKAQELKIDNIKFEQASAESLIFSNLYDHFICLGLFTCLFDNNDVKSIIRKIYKTTKDDAYLLVKDTMHRPDPVCYENESNYAAMYRNENDYLDLFADNFELINKEYLSDYNEEGFASIACIFKRKTL